MNILRLKNVISVAVFVTAIPSRLKIDLRFSRTHVAFDSINQHE